jgi:uncharacterized membrane protein YccC
MLPALLCGSLLGAIAGCLLTFAWQAWKRRRLPSHTETEFVKVFPEYERQRTQSEERRRLAVGLDERAWTQRPIFRGKR